jgi:DNA-binding HxlR family transcriptional regulator
MKRSDNKSHCPINFSLETFGDSWSLLILRDIVYFGKKTFGEFLESDEGISTNILATRLLTLEQKGILDKKTHDTDKRKEVYLISEKGLDLIPVLLELASWGARHGLETEAPESWIAAVNHDREKIVNLIRDTVRSGGSIFAGSDSVVIRLGLFE